MRPVLTLFAVCGLSVPVSAGTIHVPGDQPTIQAALNVAAPGDEIVLAPATYDISAGIDFFDSNLTLRSASGNPLDTILDGHNATSPIDIIAKSGMVFRNLTFTRGNAAVRVHLTSAVFEGCHFVHNAGTGTQVDAALLATASDVIVRDCLFDDNYSRYAIPGAALSAYGGTLTIEGSRFSRNWSPSGTSAPTSGGSAIYLAVIQNPNGGGQYVGATVHITDCVFIDNDGDIGGAISAGGANLHVDRSRFIRNHATLGGAILVRDVNINGQNVHGESTITNSVFNANTATRFQASLNGLGGALAVADGAGLIAVNNTFHWNQAQSSGGAAVVSGAGATGFVGNSILAGNTPNDFYSTGTLTIGYNLSGTPGALGLLDPIGPDGDPGTEDDDLRLAPGSQGIDAADNNLLPMDYALDAAGLPRFRDDPDTNDTGVGTAPIVDVGAFEFQPAGPCSSADFAPPYGTLNFFDVQTFLNLFAAHDPLADLIADGQFNFFDVQTFLNAYSRGC